MKTVFTFCLLLIAALSLHAQFLTPESILIKIPEIPEGIAEEKIRDAFDAQIEELRTSVSEEIYKRKRISKEKSKGMDAEAVKTLGAEQGFTMSEADMQKMKSKQMSKEEKMAMANQMMQQNYNITMEEAQAVSKMSKEGQAAYGEALTTEKMAESQANQGREAENQKKNMNRYELAQEQSLITQRLHANAMSFEEKLSEYEVFYQEATEIYRNRCHLIKKDFESRINTTLGDTYWEEEKAAYQNAYRAYCAEVVPPYKELLKERLAKIKASANDYYRLEEISNLLSQSLTGTENHTQDTGLMYLEELEYYLGLLGGFPGSYLKKLSGMSFHD